MDGKPVWLDVPGKSVARGYKSKIDGSIQSYAVWYPANYGKEPKKKWRIDLMLHGRDASLTEVKFLTGHASRATPADQDYIQIDIYGRGNNAYRWAGERDVYEALDDFWMTEWAVGRKNEPDLGRIVLKGFSMGGAGTWHLGLRRPYHFIAIQPGAGFTTTHGYVSGMPASLPSPQEELLTIYDAVNYARNAAMVPIVAYSGERDKQREAAVNIEKRLKELGLADRMTHVIGTGLEHNFPPEWRKPVDAKLRELAAVPKPMTPDKVDFTTFTTRSSLGGWAEIEGMGRHYAAAHVTGEWTNQSLTVTTANVRRLKIWRFPKSEREYPATLTIDGQKVPCAKNDENAIYWRCFALENRQWRLLTEKDEADFEKSVEKRPLLQGPIDDAFTRSFICVVGTGIPSNPTIHVAAVAQLDRFMKEWDKWFRGTLPVIKDTEVAKLKAEPKNMILFGDPSSNLVIAELLPKLPIKWTAKELVVNGVTYPADSHLPMMVFPHPNQPNTYVVLNSGHTFHEAEFKGTNAQLYPRLGDFAVVKPTPTAKEPAAFVVIDNGLFDEFWKFSRK